MLLFSAIISLTYAHAGKTLKHFFNNPSGFKATCLEFYKTCFFRLTVFL